MRPKWTRYGHGHRAAAGHRDGRFADPALYWAVRCGREALHLAKYTAEAYSRRAELLPRIREIFSAAGDIPGVRGAEVFPNCVARDNRYDVMIVLEMDRDALAAYDRSAMHHRWKDEFGPLLEKKAIFDYE